MNKQQLIRETAGLAGTSFTTANAVINNLLNVISNEINSGNSVTIRKFGRFYPRLYRDKNVRNFDGKSLVIPAHRALAFKPSRKINERL